MKSETTLVKIDADDRDVVAQVMAEFSIPCRFYTIEKNPLLLTCEIGTRSPDLIWSLAKIVGHTITGNIWIEPKTKH